MKDFAGRAAVVTGSGSGIGEGIAKALAREGCRVVVADILAENAERVATDIRRSGGEASAFGCDVSERASVRALKTQADHLYGPPSILVANAGVSIFRSLIDMSEAEIDWHLQVNLSGVFHCVGAFLPDMVAAREGHIVSTASMVGLVPAVKDHAPYVATKAGLVGMTLAMRAELAGSGVGISVLCPGRVTTNIAESRKSRPERFGGPSDEGGNHPVNVQALPVRTPDEVGEIVLRGIRSDRPIMVTDSYMKDHFVKTYANLVTAAFDDIADWERARA